MSGSHPVVGVVMGMGFLLTLFYHCGALRRTVAGAAAEAIPYGRHPTWRRRQWAIVERTRAAELGPPPNA